MRSTPSLSEEKTAALDLDMRSRFRIVNRGMGDEGQSLLIMDIE